MPHYDAVIAGGGLSGLSLAAHLAAFGWRDHSVLVVDDPVARPSAQSWGFWAAGSGLLDAAACRSYAQARIYAAGVTRLLPLQRYRYRVVRRADLRAAVQEILGGCPGYRLVKGTVEGIHDTGDGVTVTIDGRAVHCGWLFDSVTNRAAGEPVDARLAFTGWEMRCARPVFDPATPVLFDFRTPQSYGSRFVYVLPDDPQRALVELTAFVPRRAQPPTAADRSAALDRYLSDVLRAGDYQILRTESAVLPLRTRPVRRARGRILAIGAAGGLVKATTGYAYQRIQRDSAAIARSLARHGHPWDIPVPPRRYRLLDAILLDVLDRDPAQLERAFAQLFTANPTDRMLRFLDEDGRVVDDMRLIASMSPRPYLRALARRAALRRRAWSGERTG